MTTAITIGLYRSVTIDVVGWDGVGAEVDLSAACLFEREAAGNALAGGTRHLDEALDGALTRLRAEGWFKANEADMLTLTPGPGRVAASEILVIGLGDPVRWSPAVSARAVEIAALHAERMGAASVAFAPSLVDAGVENGSVEADLIAAVTHAIDATHAVADLNLGPSPALRRFVFDAGRAHLDSAAAAFRKALGNIKGAKLDGFNTASLRT